MGPLHGIRIIEFAGIGPAPFCGMMFADMGAEVILIDRRTTKANGPAIRDAVQGKFSIVNRGKKSIALDLKNPEARDVALRLLAEADGMIEGFRPGVMERFGLGPADCLAVNPRLVYGRLTGWGQEGPLAHSAGHDINYIALSGALYHGAHQGAVPSAPPTLVGDVGGGALMAAIGVLAGILNARQTGSGQVIDAAITDGSALMTSLLYGLHQAGLWSDRRQDNFLDSAAPWYDCYECADGKYISVGALEPAFYRELLDRCGLTDEYSSQGQFDKSSWAAMRIRMARLFRSRTQNEWCELLEGTEACFAPVLSFSEAAQHPHNKARGTFIERDGVTQPAPAPRFSMTPGTIGGKPPVAGENTDQVLRTFGYDESEIDRLRETGIID
jgi:alpha-methylacyl-CoA racemase